MIENETTYDNEQLATLQNELKDNSIYSGIGIIPGTDPGGGSEGGENGSGGGNQGGNSNNGGNGGSGNTNTNTNTNTDPGGDTTPGQDAQTPVISVIEGEEIAASFYRSDVTVQIYTYDKTQKIRYILTTTVEEINNELYPSGLVKEIDISNGGTLTFTKDGEYTITAYSYDTKGNKSQASIKWIKRETGTTPGNGVTVSVASGNMGQNDWYTSNITIRVLGTDTGSARVTYRVKGTGYSTGMIGENEYDPGEIDTQEVEIANGTTFKIAIDGEFAIVAYTYDSGGMRLSTATTLNVRRDATRPSVMSFMGEQLIGSGFQLSITAVDVASDLAKENRYTYRHKLAPSMTYTDNSSQETSHLYTGLEKNKTYDMYVIVKDEAGNMTASDVISKPALWVSKGTAGQANTEGKRSYYTSDIEISMTGQDENNVDISRVTYQILGTTTNTGMINGKEYSKGMALPETEYEMGNNKSFVIAADGNWTVKVHTYNKENERVSTNILEVTKDTTGPVVQFKAESTNTTTAKATITAVDETTTLASSNAYQYYVGTTKKANTNANTYNYSGLDAKALYKDTLSVIVTDAWGNTTQVSPTEIKRYLVDCSTVGDYVMYEAGTWDSEAHSGTGWSSSTSTPTSNATFGEYTAGVNKSVSMDGTLQGWRFLQRSGSGATGTATIVTAGNPAKGYFAGGNSSANQSAMVTGLNNFANDNYVNTTYASAARNATRGDYNTMNAEMRKTGVDYWLSTAYTNPSTYYRGSGSSYTGYLMAYNRSSSKYDYYMYNTYYTSYVGYGASVYYLVAYADMNGTIPVGVTAQSLSSTTANSSHYYYLYSNSPTWNSSSSSYTASGSRLYSLTSGSLYSISSSTYYGTYSEATYATRPVVVLKAGVYTNEERVDYMGQSCWKLMID